MYVGSHHKNKCHKGMGGLLPEGGRDFLVHWLGKPSISIHDLVNVMHRLVYVRYDIYQS